MRSRKPARRHSRFGLRRAANIHLQSLLVDRKAREAQNGHKSAVLWFTGMNPTKVIGSGGRVMRVTGDQYDHFNLQFSYPNGGIMESMCRQIDGCANSVSEFVIGTEGMTNCRNTIYDLDGKAVWKHGVTNPEELKKFMELFGQRQVPILICFIIFTF